MTQPSCPSAARLLEILGDSSSFTNGLDFSSYQDILSALKANGIDLENCDRDQLLLVVRDFFANLSDLELASASGGEVLKAIGVAAAAGAATAAVAVGVGAGVGGYYGAKYVQGS
jgi:hypothetical protein